MLHHISVSLCRRYSVRPTLDALSPLADEKNAHLEAGGNGYNCIVCHPNWIYSLLGVKYRPRKGFFPPPLVKLENWKCSQHTRYRLDSEITTDRFFLMCNLIIFFFSFFLWSSSSCCQICAHSAPGPPPSAPQSALAVTPNPLSCYR